MWLPFYFAIIFTFVHYTCCEVSNDKGGFIFSTPSRLFSGTNERLCITFRNTSEVARVHVSIFEHRGSTELASADTFISEVDNGTKCFSISIPRSKTQKGLLKLSVSFPTIHDYTINYTENTLIESSSDVVFIVTDKPVYNGGHAVRFRVFIIRFDLTLVEENIERIWIENPNGVQLSQWLNESSGNGFIDKSFQLSKEALTGVWNIRVKRKNEAVTSHGFIVQNYVLPRFTVHLDAPNSVNSSSDFNVSVCAKYFFQEPVHGDVDLHIYVKCSFSFYCYTNRTSMFQHLKLNPKGCASHVFRLSNVSNFAQKIIVNATVTEIGTDIKASTSADIQIKTASKGSALEFSTLTKRNHFKPGLPFKGQIITKNRSLSTDTGVMLCSNIGGRKHCEHMNLVQGLIDFVLTPTTILDKTNFSASLEMNFIDKFTDRNQHNVKLNLVPWYSPSGSYLQLESLSNGLLECNKNALFKIIYTSSDREIQQFYYQIKSRGNILEHGIVSPKPEVMSSFQAGYFKILGEGSFSEIKEFHFTLNITSHFSPKSLLLVYYILKSGEVVADTLTLNVVPCLKSKVIVKWNKNVSTPGDINTLKIETTPYSMCALSVTDRSTKYLSKASEFNIDYVFKSLSKFNVESTTWNPDDSPCRNGTPTAEAIDSFMKLPEVDSQFVDSMQAFQDFGSIIISDLAIRTRPCKEEWKIEKRSNTTKEVSDSTLFGFEVDNMKQRSGNDFNKVVSQTQDIFTNFERRIFFPETWIWDLIDMGESGKRELDVIVPHTVTEWDSETICLSKEKGIGVAEVQRMVSYQSFFLDFIVPHSVKKKEMFYLTVTVFNYETHDIPIRVSYVPSNKFISKTANYSSFCIESKSKIVHKFILEPTTIGQAIVTITAEIDVDFNGKCGNFSGYLRDVVSKKTFVKHEGFPEEDVKSGFICAENTNFDNKISWPMKIPLDVVERSVTVNSFISGDILGPSLKNIDKLINLPTGCGEQNMVMLAPNILLLEYLLLTNPTETHMVERALKNLDLGYQKQLNFRHDDGSYSAFGKEDEKGSIWLTAFVVRYLSQAQRFIHIDKNDLDVSADWILRHQLENGCFPVIGKIYHRDLKGKYFENDSSKALTAYIIISLIESGVVSANSTSMKNAVYCLKGTEKSFGTYGDLLTSYALLMMGELREAQALMFELLRSASRTYGLLWWENDGESSTESSVEMTAYGILSLLKLGGSHFTAAASDAVKWIIQFRNKNGGFMSTQDTILALEAISKLSASLPRMSDSDSLTIKLETMNQNYSFDIYKQNMLLQQERQLPVYLTEVKFSANGRGCALVQTQIKYNVRHAVHSNQLKIQLKIDSLSDIDMYFVTKFNICVRQRSTTDIVKMAVLEVFMISGFYPDRASLYDIPISRKGVRKWEEYEEKVVFYFEDLKQKKICLEFLVNQEVCVEKTSPALIKLYDYYNYKHTTSVKYSLQPECKTSDHWLNVTSEGQMYKSKRDGNVNKKLFNNGPTDFRNSHSVFSNFEDVGYDLEFADEVGPLAVYGPYLANSTSGWSCPNCLSEIPDYFAGLYCSAQAVLSVRILGSNLLYIEENLNPWISNFYRRIAPFVPMSMCTCPILNRENEKAIILIAPIASATSNNNNNNNNVTEFHFDNSVTIIDVQRVNDIKKKIEEAMLYCRQWRHGP